MNYIAIVQVKSLIGSRPEVRKTLQLLRLGKCNNVSIVQDDAIHRGMIYVVKDYCTWGEIDDVLLKEELTQLPNCIPCRNNNNGITSFKMSLHPPRKGYYDIKKTYNMDTKKGALGYRRTDIIELLRRMYV